MVDAFHNEWPFSKYSGAGNDFALFDNRNELFPVDDQNLVLRLCQRKAGIGADGVILIEPSAQADYRVRFFNSDGSEAEMCGNGLRCAGRFIEGLGEQKSTFTVETIERRHTIWLQPDGVTISMGCPTEIQLFQQLALKEQSLTLHSLNTGVPHAVIFTNFLDDVDVDALGRQVRQHPAFAPKGTNVNFVQRTESGTLKIRTYERGVEAETLACGTGAAASAIAAGLVHGMQSPVTVSVASDSLLSVTFEQIHGIEIGEVTLKGPAEYCFNGEVPLASCRPFLPAPAIPASLETKSSSSK